MILAQHISKYYGAQKVLDDVSFQANQGEIVGLLGPNGAGKSTLIKILNGYLQADDGDIVICDQPMRVNQPEMQHLIGYLPEHNPLYVDMYVKEYLSYVSGMYSVQADVGDVICRVGLQSEQHKKIRQLSKGYRQRVGLAQALIPDPKVLILDEPTTGLDPNQIVEVRELIKDIALKKTVLLSTHIMQEVQSVCDRVLIINKGKVVANDSVDHILSLSDAQQQIELELLQDIAVDDVEGLTDCVEKVSLLRRNTFLLTLNTSDDIRQEIAEKAAQKGWTILMMKRRDSDLEHVFAQLTQE